MITDEESHVRRNIVVVSSGILVASYLQLPASWLLAAILPKEMPPIEAYKLWGVGSAVLLYLAMRYKFSPEAKVAQEEIDNELQILRYDRMRKSLSLPEKNIVTFDRAQELIPNLPDLVESTLSQHNPRLVVQTRKPRVQFSSFSVSSWRVLNASIILLFTMPDDQPLPLYVRPDTKIKWGSLSAWCKFSVPTHLKIWTYSASSIKHIVPSILGVAAGLVLVYRLVTAILEV